MWHLDLLLCLECGGPSEGGKSQAITLMKAGGPSIVCCVEQQPMTPQQLSIIYRKRNMELQTTYIFLH